MFGGTSVCRVLTTINAGFRLSSMRHAVPTIYRLAQRTTIICVHQVRTTDRRTSSLRSMILLSFTDSQHCQCQTEWYNESWNGIVGELTLSPPIPLRLYTLTYWSNRPFLIFDVRALWRSVLSARAPERQKLKMVG